VTNPTPQAHQQAKETLDYIRQTMESASTFTAVSGWGLVGVGALGLIASWVTWAAKASALLEVWVPTALVALAVSGTGNAIKARRLNVPLWSGSFRKMAWGLVPALTAGAFLTLALTKQGATHLLPGAWLAVYGAGVTASGTFSVRSVRWMGLAMLTLGGSALLWPQLGLGLLALGFGGFHTAFGLYIVIRHGG
jgi:hypothetical protein